ncbi:TIGR03545 family protein [Candidatus Nitronereus thalassa]|uniref:TIGR03545 family protein n=1 Tax=Candidatus Nitronereus thalassa TaxID=3020898 RepID=A0ABU3K4N9_9BACT|nr:TIGR03545 family protein [Candidatus Nitronereus thalassa]MDT7041332.1 TIGR03545 family protein [Candidatus Nitronereus thalassa]
MTQPKTGVIRWWGLGAFVVLVCAIAALWLLVVDGLVKALIEEEGTKAVGAKVELGSADLTLIPAGLRLTRFQVTNPEKPMTNMVEIANLVMSLDGLQLLRRKVLISEMTVEDVQFGTARATSGAIEVRSQKLTEGPPQEELSFTLPPLKVPNVEQILEQEDLETLKLVRTIQNDIHREQEVWKQRLKTLPGQAEFAKYQKRIEELRSSTKKGVGDVLGGVEELKTIKQEIEQDLENLKSARKEFNEKIALLKQRIAQVQSAPQRDLNRLKEKYSLSPKGLANLGESLLGKQIGEKLQEGVGWYEMVQPYLGGIESGDSSTEDRPAPERGEGIDVHFTEYQPVPEFLIRLAKVSFLLDIGQIQGQIKNITPEPHILDLPLTFAFAGKQLKDVQSVTIQGTLDHRNPEQPQDTIQFQAKEYQLQPVALSTQPEWPVVLKNGVADVTVNAQLRGQAITAIGSTDLSSLQVVAGKPGDANPLTNALSGAVSDISTLSVQAEITGTVQQYDVRIQSELDRILKEAAGKMVKNLAASFGKDLQSAISAKVSEPLKALTGSLGGLDSIGGELTNRLAKENDLLKGLLEQGLPKNALPKGLPEGLPDKLPGGFKLPF